jgi:hypothetical protein
MFPLLSHMVKGLPRIVYTIRSFFGEGVKSHLSGFFLLEVLSPIGPFEGPTSFNVTAVAALCETTELGFVSRWWILSGSTVSSKAGSRL